MAEMNDIDPKLLKIIALAKHGIGGEKETAIALVKKICQREGLTFEEVMSDRDESREFDVVLKWRNKIERQIIINILYKFALSPEHKDFRMWEYDKSVRYTTTPAKHLETVNAAAVYLKAYRKERKKIEEDLMSAFLDKHHIYPDWETGNHKDDDDEPDIDLERAMRIAAMTRGMDDVNIRKSIGDGDREK